MKTFDLETTFETEEHGTITVVASGTVSTFYPSTMYDSHGNPGSDSEGGEVTYGELKAWDWEDNEITFPDYLFEELDEKAIENAD